MKIEKVKGLRAGGLIYSLLLASFNVPTYLTVIKHLKKVLMIFYMFQVSTTGDTVRGIVCGTMSTRRVAAYHW